MPLIWAAGTDRSARTPTPPQSSRSSPIQGTRDPDHMVDNDPKLEAEGRDQQLEKAVEELLSQLEESSP